MAYLFHLPDVVYPSPLSHKNSSKDTIIVKNLFRKAKLKQWLSDSVYFFNKSYIADGERPDTVANGLYGDSHLDFIVVISALVVGLGEGFWVGGR